MIDMDGGTMSTQQPAAVIDAQINQDTMTSPDDCVSQGKKDKSGRKNVITLDLTLKSREWGLMIMALREISERYEKQARVARIRSEYTAQYCQTRGDKWESIFADRINDLNLVARVAAELACDIEEHKGIKQCNVADVRNVI